MSGTNSIVQGLQVTLDAQNYPQEQHTRHNDPAGPPSGEGHAGQYDHRHRHEGHHQTNEPGQSPPGRCCCQYIQMIVIVG